MQELEALLKRHDDNIEFDHLNNRIRCYPHIINICASHIIASSTRVSKEFLEAFKSETEADMVCSNVGDDNDDNGDDGDDDDSDDDDSDDDDSDDDDSDDDDGDDDDGDDDDDNDNDGHSVSQEPDVPELTLDAEKLSILDGEARSLYTGLKRDPIKRARRIVSIVRSSDQRRQAFKDVIKTGNQSGQFRSHNNEVIKLPDLQLLRDVRTRWDSVYRMIERLLVLRPVSVHHILFIYIVKI